MVEFWPNSAVSAPIPVISGSAVAEFEPNLVAYWPNLAESGRFRPSDPGPNLAEIGPISPIRTKFGRRRANFGRMWLISGRVRAIAGRVWAFVGSFGGPIWAESGRFRARFGGFRAEIGRNGAESTDLAESAQPSLPERYDVGRGFGTRRRQTISVHVSRASALITWVIEYVHQRCEIWIRLAYT